MALYRGVDGTVVEAAHDKNGRTTFWERGGSFKMTTSTSSFSASFRPHEPSDALSEGLFCGVWLPEGVVLRGYSSGDVWNGWSTPHFSLEEGRRLVGLMEGQLSFDQAANSFVDLPGGYGTPTLYRARECMVDGQRLNLYGIGAGSWCWRRMARGSTR